MLHTPHPVRTPTTGSGFNRSPLVPPYSHSHGRSGLGFGELEPKPGLSSLTRAWKTLNIISNMVSHLSHIYGNIFPGHRFIWDFP